MMDQNPPPLLLLASSYTVFWQVILLWPLPHQPGQLSLGLDFPAAFDESIER
jgi:hypothetical protein